MYYTGGAMREPRSELVPVRFTRRDKAAVEKAAAAAGMNTSEYIRAATLMSMALSANPHAIRMLGHGLAELVSELVPGREKRATTQ